MSIYINKDTKVITQGITGKTGQFHTEKCQEYANGKNCFVAGVNPKKAGESIFNIPIYASVKEAAHADRRHRVRDLRAARQAPLPPSGKPSKPTWTWLSASPKASRCATCSKCATR
jgi:succinyl-CoA synthetase alpha subunit